MDEQRVMMQCWKQMEKSRDTVNVSIHLNLQDHFACSALS